jgi:hypothetical protein
MRSPGGAAEGVRGSYPTRCRGASAPRDRDEEKGDAREGVTLRERSVFAEDQLEPQPV